MQWWERLVFLAWSARISAQEWTTPCELYCTKNSNRATRGCDNGDELQGNSNYLTRVCFIAVTASHDDGDGGCDDGVGSTHHCREASPKEWLAQGIDASNEQQRLNHPGLLLLTARKEIRTAIDSLSLFDITIHKLAGCEILEFRTWRGDWFTHVSSSHLGNKSTWYDDRRAQHHNVVLESKDDGLSCMFQII